MFMPDVRDLKRSAQRRMPLFLTLFLPMIALVLLVAHQVPERYEAEAVFVLDPGQSKPSAAQGELMRVLALKAGGLEQLNSLIRTHPVFDGHTVKSLKNRLKIYVNSGREKATVTTIEAKGKSAEEAFTLAQETQNFLQARYRLHVSTQGSDSVELAEERLLLARQSLELAEANRASTLPASSRDIQSLRNQMVVLDRAIAREQSNPGSSKAEQARVETQLNAARSRMSPDHPKVRLLQAELDAILATSSALETEDRLAQLITQRERISEQLTAVQIRLETQNTGQRLFREAQMQLEQASVGLERAERISEVSRAQEQARLNLVVPATRPDSPRFPNPNLVTLLGLIFALIASFALTWLHARSDQTIRTRNDLERYFGIEAFAVFPDYDPVAVKV